MSHDFATPADFLVCGLNLPPLVTEPQPVPTGTECAITGQPITSGYPVAEMVTEATAEFLDCFRGGVHEACQQVAEWMWARPGCPSVYHIPEEWWITPIGNLVLRGLLWSEGDELITVSQAAEMAGLTVSAVSQWIVRGKVTAYRDLSEPNTQRQTRVKRSDVEKMRKV
jgi:hypothetical protein